LTSPNGGEILKPGSVHNITWETYGTGKPVGTTKLFFTQDGGTTWAAISTLAGNPGTYPWTFPSVASTKGKCRVKVTLKDANGKVLCTDTSDGYFAIQP
jgi:hypothetical protein